MKKKSLFERLTGSVNIDEYDFEEEDEVRSEPKAQKPNRIEQSPVPQSSWLDEENHEGQLTVDVYQTPTHIVIKTLVAGVKRDDLDISISRDIVTIRGKREEDRSVSENDYFHKELYWGTFSRTIMLPHEVEIDGAEANENMGLLTIRLPKINKERQTKLRVMKSLSTQ
jgi:HSP20 family molecular chaperone IbpA